MRATATEPRQKRLHAGNTGFTANLIYDTEENARVAEHIFRRICVRLPDTATMRLHLWPYECLGDLQKQLQGKGNVTDVNAIIISVAGVNPLPGDARAALERLAFEGAARLGFITLFSNVSENKKQQSPAYHYFKGLMVRSGRDWFSRGLAHEATLRLALPITAWEDAHFTPNFVPVSIPTTRWGINE